MNLPCDRLPEESAPAYAAFTTYLALGPERSAQIVAEKVGKSSRVIQRWCSKHAWVARAAGYDNHLNRVELELKEVELRAKAVDWTQRRAELREREYRVSMAVLEKLTRFIEDERVELKTFRDFAGMLTLMKRYVETRGAWVDRNVAEDERNPARLLQRRQHVADAPLSLVDLVEEEDARHAEIVELAHDELQGRNLLFVRLGHDHREVAGGQHRLGLEGEFDRAGTIDEGDLLAHEFGGCDRRLDAHGVGARLRRMIRDGAA